MLQTIVEEKKKSKRKEERIEDKVVPSVCAVFMGNCIIIDHKNW